jgi:LDH2 family malate/lactate/ureidoglycolate dehydrogenase
MSESQTLMSTMSHMRIASGELHATVSGVFEAVGLSAPDAAIMADCLVGADERGASSHGVIRLPFLVARIVDGGAKPKPELKLVSDAPAIAVVDGDQALGPVSASFAMRTAMSKAADCGIGFVVVRNSDFIGTCAHSAMIALEDGMIGMTWTNGFPGMAPFGGRANAIGNNPIAFALPGGPGGPVVLDMAMSVAAGGKVRHAAKQGKPIPAGWVVTADGDDTTDPAQLPAGGALLPLGHKGYGLAVVGEAIAGVLAGASILGAIPQWFTATNRPIGNGHVHLAIDIKRFLPVAEFEARMVEMGEELKKTPLRPGVDEILLPGEGAERRVRTARTQGILLPPEVAKDLNDLAIGLGRPAPTFSQNR